MTKFLKTVISGLQMVAKSILSQWLHFMGLLWMFASFLYISEPEFWTVLGFGIIFTGIQNITNELKLK
tara:strand:+ start:1223 stop:1426 length:204 start_codon:yes stop_codon:yes gene_type:complete